jgi:hypothetical protein
MFLGYCEVYAQEYQLPEIEDIAMSFLNKNMQNTSTRSNAAATKKISTIEAINRNNSDYMYIVNTEDSAGWVLISNEKKYPTVIAHADSGSLFMTPKYFHLLYCAYWNNIWMLLTQHESISEHAHHPYQKLSLQVPETLKNIRLLFC